jgi:Hemerythrin HHE cation binding domain
MLAEHIRSRLWSRLTENHASLKHILEDVAWLVQHGSLITAAKRFGEFRIAQEREMNFEESTLFPLIERLSDPNEAIRQGRAQHETIRHLLNAVSASLSTSTVQEFVEAYRQLLTVILEHCKFEERLISLELKSSGNEVLEEIQSGMRRL